MAPYQETDVLLDVRNVSLSLGRGAERKLILRDINLQVKNVARPGMVQGQIVGFLGPSGIGKTQLLNILAGLRKPDTGTVCHGKPLRAVRTGGIGVVQQNYPLFEHRSVYANLLIAAKLCRNCGGHTDKTGMNSCGDCRQWREHRVDEILGQFGLSDKRNCYPAELSGGQRQRIAIAQQLMSADHYLLLDEPFSGLDLNMIKEVSGVLKSVACMHDENTIIIVSHDISATAALADTLWIMGRDRNADGSLVPGAYIKHTVDLKAMGLAWDESSHGNPQFAQLLHEVRSLFPTL